MSSLAGRITVLFGTRVTLSGEASKPVVSAEANFSSGDKIDLHTDGNRFYGNFKVEKNDTMSFAVADSAGLCSDSSVRYPLVCRSDRAPSIEILSPDDQASLPRSLRTMVLLLRLSVAEILLVLPLSDWDTWTLTDALGLETLEPP